MPESPEQLHARAARALRAPAVHDWDTWPFEGEIRPKALAPLTPEPRIHGAGGVGCRACEEPDNAGPADLPDELARGIQARLDTPFLILSSSPT